MGFFCDFSEDGTNFHSRLVWYLILERHDRNKIDPGNNGGSQRSVGGLFFVDSSLRIFAKISWAQHPTIIYGCWWDWRRWTVLCRVVRGYARDAIRSIMLIRKWNSLVRYPPKAATVMIEIIGRLVAKRWNNGNFGRLSSTNRMSMTLFEIKSIYVKCIKMF